MNAIQNATYSHRTPPSTPVLTAKSYFARRAEREAIAAAETEMSAGPGQPFLPRRRGSTAEAAQILGCSTSLVRWLIASGQLVHVERPGKRQFLLDLDEVHRYRLKKMEDRNL